MGCCVAASGTSRMQNSMNDAIAQQREIAKQQEAAKSSAPYISATGEVIVPMNGMTGEFPTAFPVWLNGKITNDEYTRIINKLNEITMPAFSNQIAQSEEMMNDMVNGFGNRATASNMMKQQTAMTQKSMEMQTQLVTMTRNVESALYEINSNILKGKGVTILSLLSSFANGAAIAQMAGAPLQMQAAAADKGIKIVINNNNNNNDNLQSSGNNNSSNNNQVQEGADSLPNYTQAHGQDTYQ